MTFEEILPALRRGEVVRRISYDKNLVIFMQVPAEISCENVSTMKSITEQMKVLMNRHSAGIVYHDQFMLYDFYLESATYYVFNGEDINAEDWELVDPLSYNPRYESES